MWLWIIFITIALLYAALMLTYWFYWKRVPVFSADRDSVFHKKLSVLIPVRNEAAYIGRLLECLQNQQYPSHLLQIIVINDNSTDDTRNIVSRFEGIKIIDLDPGITQAHKKRAIEAAIQQATGDWIITTDGDCTMDTKWLSTLMAFQNQTSCGYIAAPVLIEANNTLVQQFQQIDFAILQGITAVSVHHHLHAMSNGANQAYEKQLFLKVNGYSGVDQIASGDDMLLLQKINASDGDRVKYLLSKDAIVRTAAVKSWKEFFQQRIRWASKARYYKEPKLIAVMLNVYLLNLFFLPVLFFSAFALLPWWSPLAFLLGKSLVEWPFVNQLRRFYNIRIHFGYYCLMQPLHIGYTIISGFLGLVGKYNWKDRTSR